MPSEPIAATAAPSSVDFEKVGSDYFQQRELKKGAAGWVLLVGLGVAYVISGDYAGWNFGLAQGGWGGMFIATLLMATMYLCMCFSLGQAEVPASVVTRNHIGHTQAHQQDPAGSAFFQFTLLEIFEFFEVDGGLKANEIAPRVHNSGHWTTEGAECSQFENHLRAIAGLPLADTGHERLDHIFAP